MAVDRLGWTTKARGLRTDWTIRTYDPSGTKIRTLANTERLNYKNGKRYHYRNPRDPVSGPGLSKVTLSVGKDGDGKAGCTMTFRQPAVGNDRLVWSDEFDGIGVDRSKWTIENNSTYGDGNDELACLTDRASNVSEADGVLTIHATHEPGYRCGRTTRDYTSAMLLTRGHADWQYGYVEMRAQLPTQAGTSKGLWPAFWMRPTTGGTGELDVMEALGSDHAGTESDKVHQTLWYDYKGTYPHPSHTHTFRAGQPSDGFHIYAVRWEPDSIRWYVDGELTYTRTRATTPWLTSVFSKPFFLRLNMAVGGRWPGSPDSATDFTAADYKVDYVRVYQR